MMHGSDFNVSIISSILNSNIALNSMWTLGSLKRIKDFNNIQLIFMGKYSGQRFYWENIKT